MTTQTDIFRRLVRTHIRPPPVRVAAGTTVGDVVNRMTDLTSAAAVVVDGTGRPIGIVTEQDVVRRIAWRTAPDRPVETVMSAPVVTAGVDDYLFHAVAVMRRRKLRHIPIVETDGSLCGMLALHEALALLSGPTMTLIEQLTHEESVEGLQRIKAAQVELASALFDDNVPVPEVQALLTEINSDIHRRVVRRIAADLAADGWGGPPVAFSLIIMGSGGRGENFLAPDQDNGMILADYPETEHNRITAYFVELADRMTRMLDAVGFPLCKGYVMATNPVWRKPLAQWRQQVDLWVRRRHERDLLNAQVLFDFHPIYGDAAPAHALRAHIARIVPKNSNFLHDIHAADSDHTVALNWFGGLRGRRDTHNRPGAINLKMNGTLPLVEGVRLLALRAGIAETSTLARLDALKAKGMVQPQDHDYLVDAIQTITRLLLRQQVADFKAGRDVTDYVAKASLSKREKEHLVRSFRAIDTFIRVLRSEFGAATG
ncbi:MAG: DUF294 nucleotidyltransferase-like domain-containing protein [Hyphomicrobiaceae bacterium]